MGKKKSRKYQDNRKGIQNEQKTVTRYMFRNISIALSFCGILFVLFRFVAGYSWFVNDFFLGNVKILWKYDDITIDKKYEMKLGADYRFINFVKNNTPQDAVILMPPNEFLNKKPFNTNESWGIKSKLWNTYFLYPRKVVKENEKTTSPLYAQVTHVMIVDYWGYDKLAYQVAKKEKYAVLPLDVSGRSE